MNAIREMVLNDLEEVAELDVLAFQAERRSLQHLEACLALNPRGCFVATALDGRPIGYVFSRIWGRLGWLGVGGVHPDYQQAGLGKALARKVIQYLQEAA